MNEITNINFVEIHQLIEQINKECSSKLGIPATVNISVGEFGSLIFCFIVRFKGGYHSF